MRYGRQRWKLKGRIEVNSRQSWDGDEMVFMPLITDLINIKVLDCTASCHSKPHHRSHPICCRYTSLSDFLSGVKDDNTGYIGAIRKTTTCALWSEAIDRLFSKHVELIYLVFGPIRWQNWRAWPLTCWWAASSVRPRSCLLPCPRWWPWMSTTWGPLNSTWRSRGSK